LEGLHEKISHLIQELDFLLWMSKDAGLREPENLLRIYGQSLESDELDERAALWEQHKEELYSAAYAVLGVLNPQEMTARKRDFIEVLKRFCKSTQEMNRDFTARTLHALEDVVSKSDEEPVIARAAE
jgi:hypothetical protein